MDVRNKTRRTVSDASQLDRQHRHNKNTDTNTTVSRDSTTQQPQTCKHTYHTCKNIRKQANIKPETQHRKHL